MFNIEYFCDDTTALRAEGGGMSAQRAGNQLTKEAVKQQGGRERAPTITP